MGEFIDVKKHERIGNTIPHAWSKEDINKVAINNLLPIILMSCPLFFHYHDNLHCRRGCWLIFNKRDRRGRLGVKSYPAISILF